MKAVILIVALLVPLLAGADEWRPTSWRETVSEWEARQPPPVCEERRLAVVGDSVMMHKDFAGYLHDRWVQFGDWYEWDDRFNGESEPDIYVQGFFRKGGGVSLINELMWSALEGDFRPTHVVIFGGINDCAMHGHSSEKNAEYVIQALDAFVHHILDYGAKPLLMQHHPWKGSRYDKKGKGWECSKIVNQWIWGEQLMADGDGAQIVWTGSLSACQSVSRPDGEECDCEYTFPVENKEECADVRVLDSYLDAGDGLHLKWVGQCAMAQCIHSYLEW